MSGGETNERRTRHLSPHVRVCRLCWQMIEVDRRYIEVTDVHVYVRCGHCRGSFPIRHSDVEALTPSAS